MISVVAYSRSFTSSVFPVQTVHRMHAAVCFGPARLVDLVVWNTYAMVQAVAPT
jgi:hypothetical protein